MEAVGLVIYGAIEDEKPSYYWSTYLHKANWCNPIMQGHLNRVAIGLGFLSGF